MALDFLRVGCKTPLLMRRVAGRYVVTSVVGEPVRAFLPNSLPPSSPAFKSDRKMAAAVSEAEHALRRVEVAADLVPSTDWLLYTFLRKEAVVSSQIEGTQATLVDLLAREGDADRGGGVVPAGDVRDVCNHVSALEYALGQLRTAKGLPVSIRLMNEAHKRLMKGTRGDRALPGAIRRSQNWIGGTRPGNAVFVPPPPEMVPELLSQLERYIHGSHDLPVLVRIGLVHAQFETIHPYLDGNGRIGRLLITLLLEHWKALSSPVLYLSLFFKQHRAEYYRRLLAVRDQGDWEGWVQFFLEGVVAVSEAVVKASRELFKVVAEDRAAALASKDASVSTLRLFQVLPSYPILTVAKVTRLLKVSKPTAGKAIDSLEGQGILKETTGRGKDRVYAYSRYLDKLREGTDLEDVEG